MPAKNTPGSVDHPAEPTPLRQEPGVAMTGRPNRQELRRRRQLEKEGGVPFTMEHDGFTAQVRMLNIYERATLIGLPSGLQQQMLEGFNARDTLPKPGERSMQDMIDISSEEEKTANIACVLGFVWPRLTETEEEADQAGDPDNVWWVEDVALHDRKRYLMFISGRNQEEMRKIRRFLQGQKVAGVEGGRPGGGRQAS